MSKKNRKNVAGLQSHLLFLFVCGFYNCKFQFALLIFWRVRNMAEVKTLRPFVFMSVSIKRLKNGLTDFDET